jgi:hypothetical protein
MKLSLQALMVALAALARVDATVILYEIDNAPATWITVIADRTIVVQYDWDDLPDFGQDQRFEGPITSSDGAGPVPIGFMPAGFSIGRRDIPGSPDFFPGLVAYSPRSNVVTGNAILANQLEDAITSDYTGEPLCGYEFTAVNLFGSDTVTITATDHDDKRVELGTVSGVGFTFGLEGVVPADGRRVGIFSSTGIKSVEIFDQDGFGDGNEGTMGNHIWYSCPDKVRKLISETTVALTDCISPCAFHSVHSHLLHPLAPTETLISRLGVGSILISMVSAISCSSRAKSSRRVSAWMCTFARK